MRRSSIAVLDQALDAPGRAVERDLATDEIGKGNAEADERAAPHVNRRADGLYTDHAAVLDLTPWV